MAHVTTPLAHALAVEECRLGDCVVLTLHGDLDLDGSATLLAAFDETMADAVPYVVVNLEELDFLDCAGIGALMEARRRMHLANGDFKVTGANGRVSFVLQSTGADAVLLDGGGRRGVDDCPECHGTLKQRRTDERAPGASLSARCTQCGIRCRMGAFGWLYDPTGSVGA